MLTATMFPFPSDIVSGIATTSAPFLADLTPWILAFVGILLAFSLIALLIRAFLPWGR